MTSKVVIDADELDLFISKLSQFNRDLASQSSSLQARFHRLGETWRDPDYAKFAQEFAHTMKSLEQFRRIADEVVPKLRSLSQRTKGVHR